nr:hypothetical protein [Streptomyces sp. HUCO-GS316]
MRLKLPYIRRALTDLIPTAKAQHWDLAEVVRVLLAEEAVGRHAANFRTRRQRAGFPVGKAFGDWDETASSMSRQVQDSLKTLPCSHHPTACGAPDEHRFRYQRRRSLISYSYHCRRCQSVSDGVLPRATT